ncbi:MAG: FAD:protein FMN transferase [Candidatus Lindowbacteria bacterium]|nr:FAD:protein FMN transferase [Candidatus Lindowbacteria bacterium]
MVSRAWPVMGTLAEVTIESDRPSVRQGMEVVRQIFDRVDRTMSVYKRSSDIVRANWAAGKSPVEVDRWVAEVAQQGIKASAFSSGAFSITTLQEGIQAGLKPQFGMPRHDSLEFISRTAVSEISVDVDGGALFLPNEGIGMDFGGIAKGFALDKAAEALHERGFHKFLIDLGRSVIVGDAPEDQPGWRVQIVGDATPICINNESIAVSAQFVNSEVPHIVDPATRRPVNTQHQIVVSAKKGIDADFVSTALLVNPEIRTNLESTYSSINWMRDRRAVAI